MDVDKKVQIRIVRPAPLTYRDYDLFRSLGDRLKSQTAQDATLTSSTSLRVTTPGEALTDDQGYMRGHGTYVRSTGTSSNSAGADADGDGDEDGDGEDLPMKSDVSSIIISSVAGAVERVNRLVTVLPLRSRYVGAVGDLVVGRITDVTSKRWKVDCGSRQDASLLLSSINLPGGIQRRKNEADELQMRTFFKEGDLLVAEVQALHQDGAISLHTRSLKYGKLRDGLLVRVQPTLISRLKTHFISLSACPITVILGLNGYIWIQSRTKKVEESRPDQEMDGYDEAVEAQAVYSDTNQPFREELFIDLVRVRNVIIGLGKASLPILDSSIEKVFAMTYQLNHDLARTTDDGAMSFAIKRALSD